MSPRRRLGKDLMSQALDLDNLWGGSRNTESTSKGLLEHLSRGIGEGSRKTALAMNDSGLQRRCSS